MSAADDLRAAIRDYSMRGYPVEVPIFGPAIVVEQLTLGHGSIYIKVVPDQALPFDEYANARGSSDDPQGMEFWERHNAFSTLPNVLQDVLERGGSVSQRDLLRKNLLDRDCLHDGLVTCESFPIEEIGVPHPQVGMILDFEDHPKDESIKTRTVRYRDKTGWAGRVVDVRYLKWIDVDREYGPDGKKVVKVTRVPMEGDVIFVEQFIPVPFMEGPEAMVPQVLQPGFQSSSTRVLGYGLGHAWERVAKNGGTPMPAGKWLDEDGKPPQKQPKDDFQYVLEEPMSFGELQDFCQENYPDEPTCAAQAMFLFVVPIYPGGEPPDVSRSASSQDLL